MRRVDFRLLGGSILILAGAAILAVALVGYLRSPAWQTIHAEEVLQAPSLTSEIQGPLPGSALARLRIPRIGLDVAVIEGTDPADLLKAPGHMTGSALPGGPANCILAGHRDLHFKRLGELQRGDRVDLQAGERTYSYRIDSIKIVAPTESSVLQPGNEAILTLITCYPFRFVGSAPKRYVVVARLAGSAESP